jgi:hypothetical protein
VVIDPDGGTLVISGVVAVLEGVATAVAEPTWVRTARATRGGDLSGDDVVVATAAQLVEEGRSVTAVTADRALRARLGLLASPGAASLQSAGPGWLLAEIRGVVGEIRDV